MILPDRDLIERTVEAGEADTCQCRNVGDRGSSTYLYCRDD
jgi:hypothetical protein